MEMKKIKVKKGLLLTLLVIVLFVLMLGEVITYVVINVNYDSLTQSASSASTQGATVALISLGATSALHSSLAAALGTLTTIESNTALRNGLIINNTQYSLVSLMTNGTIDGANFGKYMDAALISNVSNSINASLGGQGISVIIVGGNLSVFQGTPSTINASYYAEALVNTTSGRYLYPIKAMTSVQLNGTLDIVGAQMGMPGTISIQKSLPVATEVGGINAIMGSTGRFSFVYGTVFTDIQSSAILCTGLPSSAPSGQSANGYILVVYNAVNLQSNICGFGGLITEQNSIPSGSNVPYLVYTPSNSFNSIWQNANLTKVLLDGNALTAYNLSTLQSAIQNNKYFTSPYVPSYIDQQSVFTQRQVNGLFSFGVLNLGTPWFMEPSTPLGTLAPENYISVNQITVPNTFTISFWFNEGAWLGGCDNLLYIGSTTSHNLFFDLRTIPEGSRTNCAAGSAQNSSLYALYAIGGTDYGGGLWGGSGPYYGTTGVTPLKWTQAAVVVGGGTLAWYLDGNPAGNYILTTQPANQANTLLLGNGAGGTSGDWWGFNGSLADVQVYNAMLTSLQVQKLYREGITGVPVISANLVAWYPLNGNANDYSGHNNGGYVNSITFNPIYGYYADPIYRNILTNSTVEEVPGVLNCMNINQCTAQNQSHLYLGSYPLSYAGNVAINESAALGLGKAVLPDMLNFQNELPSQSYGTNAFVGEPNSITWTGTQNSFSISIWVYPTVANAIVVDVYNTPGLHQPLISVYNNNLYVGLSSSSCTEAESNADNKWTQIGLTYNGLASPTFYWYINGQLGSSGSPSYNPLFPVFYGLGKTDTNNCAGSSGQENSYSGYMSSFQVYNTALSSSQMLTLFLNGSVNAIKPNINMPLSAYYDNIPNLTTETMANDYGIFFQGSGAACSTASVLNNTCGISITPP